MHNLRTLLERVTQRLHCRGIAENERVLKWVRTGLTYEVSSSRCYGSTRLKYHGPSVRPVNSEGPRQYLRTAGDIPRNRKIVKRSATRGERHRYVVNRVAQRAGVDL